MICPSYALIFLPLCLYVMIPKKNYFPNKVICLMAHGKSTLRGEPMQKIVTPQANGCSSWTRPHLTLVWLATKDLFRGAYFSIKRSFTCNRFPEKKILFVMIWWYSNKSIHQLQKFQQRTMWIWRCHQTVCHTIPKLSKQCKCYRRNPWQSHRIRVYSDADQRKHQSSASLAFVWGIHRDRWIPRTKGQLRGKCFHLMTSSCVYEIS